MGEGGPRGPGGRVRSVAPGRLRVLILVTSLDAGGAQRHVRDLLLHGRGAVDFHLAGGTPGWLAREAARLGVPVYPLPLANPLRPGRDLRTCREILRLVARLRPQVLHVHSTKAAFLGRIAGALSGTPVVYTVHGWAFQSGSRLPLHRASLAAEHLVRGFSARVITVSRRDADIALRARLAPAGRLRVIANGIDPSAYLWHPGPYDRRLLYLGRLEPGKGLEALLDALAGLVDLPWTLGICGTGRREGLLRSRVQRRGLTDRVRFLGWVDDPRPVLAESDCLVLPSDKEGLPYSVLEALATGLYLIVTDVGGLGDLTLRQVTRIPPRDPGALREALRDFLEHGWRDPSRRPHQEEVSALLTQRYHVRRMVEETIAVYGDVASPHGAVPPLTAPEVNGDGRAPASSDSRAP